MRQRNRCFESLVWLALALAFFAGNSLPHVHAERAHAETQHDPSAWQPTEPVGAALVADEAHEDHSTQIAVDHSTCGICRSAERPCATRRACEALDLSSARTLLPPATPASSLAAVRQGLNPPRAPPA
jgi:hypothetical protein